MRNLVVKPKLTDNDHHLNIKTIEAHIDDDYYVVDFYPSDCALSGNGTVPTTAATLVSLPAGNETISILQFSNGNADEVKIDLRTRLYWEKGALEVTVYYTGSVNSTNDIRFSLRGYSHAIGDDITAASTLSVDATTPGPATALTLKKYTFTSYLAFSREMELCHFSLYRDSAHASDTYAGDVYVPIIKVRLIPAMVQTGTKL